MPGTLLTKAWEYNPVLDAPARHRRACRYDTFVPADLSTLELRLRAAAVGAVSEAEHAIRDLNAVPATDLRAMGRLLLRSESIASSKIEGMQLDARELARAEARLDTGGRVSDTACDVIANIDAMILAVENAASVETFEQRDILDVHKKLMERATNRRVAARFRTEQNWIGGNDYNPCGADFVPPPPEELPRLLDDLCRTINDDVLPPVVQAALVHAQFETIHPFHDGNGRTGRALIHVVLRRRKIAAHYVPPISVTLSTAKERYIGGLTAFRADDVQGWIEYFADAARSSARLATRYLNAVRALCERWKEQLRASPSAPRSDAAAWRLIEALPGHPTITTAVAIEAVGRSRPQVLLAMEQLVAAGVLTPVSENRRNMAWEAIGLLDLIVQLEAGQLPAQD
ncbi:MAG TPA: Fic family protein [Gemmatimonadaceae bacterium]|jgi:Fic family protein